MEDEEPEEHRQQAQRRELERGKEKGFPRPLGQRLLALAQKQPDAQASQEGWGSSCHSPLAPPASWRRDGAPGKAREALLQPQAQALARAQAQAKGPWEGEPLA